jgi:Family of unknown function (DUF6529)
MSLGRFRFGPDRAIMPNVDQNSIAAPRRSSSIPVLAIVLGAAVAVLLGVNDRRHPGSVSPVKLGFDSVIQMKTWLALVVGVLLLVQLIGGLWMYGRLGRPAPSWVGPAHRTVGVVAVVISLPVAYDCLLAFGIQSYQFRVLLHSLLGCAVYGALVVKVFAVRSRTAPSWFLPVAGGVLFAVFMAAVLTSAVWYSVQYGFPTGNQY